MGQNTCSLPPCGRCTGSVLIGATPRGPIRILLFCTYDGLFYCTMHDYLSSGSSFRHLLAPGWQCCLGAASGHRASFRGNARGDQRGIFRRRG